MAWKVARPLVVILGATGSGKTKLSLDLAKKFGGEVIGADSMQLYRGLDVVTAKATKEEQKVVRHHLIDCLDPQEAFTVFEYRNKALEIIERLQNEALLPVVVGGTNYYIEAILWNILVESSAEKGDFIKVLSEEDWNLSGAELHAKLKEVDPESARRLHPNNKRKILRALEVLNTRGKKLSEILDEQHNEEGGSSSGGKLRFPEAIVFWLRCDQEVLNRRLDKRVDQMIEEGLVEELLAFHEAFNAKRLKQDESPDYTRGIFQSIGLKEFHPFLTLSEEARKSEEGQKTFAESVEQLKMITRRYSKKQTKWTLNRFLGRADRMVPPIYGLDTTDPSKWHELVLQPATQIMEHYLSGSKCEISPLQKIPRNSQANLLDDSHFCETCQRIFVGLFQWETHLKSHNHRRRLEGRKKVLQNTDK